MRKKFHKLAPELDPKIDYLKSNMLSNTDLVKVPDFSKYSIAELNGYTQNVLLKDCDNMGMANSIEIRSPFFDHDLVSHTFSQLVTNLSIQIPLKNYWLTLYILCFLMKLFTGKKWVFLFHGING